MAINYQVFKNVSSVSMGSTNYPMYGVQNIQVTETRAEIHASGDADTYEPIADVGAARVTVAITNVDPTDALEWEGGSGDLAATFEDANGSSNKTLAITGCVVTSVTFSGAHDSPSSATVNLIAHSSDGTTNPVTVS